MNDSSCANSPDIFEISSKSLFLVPGYFSNPAVRIESTKVIIHRSSYCFEQLWRIWPLSRIVLQTWSYELSQLNAVINWAVLKFSNLSLIQNFEPELSMYRSWRSMLSTYGFPDSISISCDKSSCEQRTQTYGSSGSIRIKQQMIRPMLHTFVLLVTYRPGTAQLELVASLVSSCSICQTMYR